MIQIFKIFHGLDKMEMNNNFSFQKNQTRGHCFKYYREISRLAHWKNFIFNRSANLWNFLPKQSVKPETVNGLKQVLIAG